MDLLPAKAHMGCMMNTFLRFKMPSAPVLAWFAAVGAFILLVGASAAQIEALAPSVPEPAKTEYVPNDPYGCYELEFLGEDPACARPYAPMPMPGPMASILGTANA
ncbi:hypothetical protein [Pannonibacter sp.]|uniref:hypothetical protein n=1 Tax=Pannonibacter sp. TaxID=1906786 RepID=UPI003F71235B